jgi:outer membrane biosynthesis protein TonB
MKRTAPFAALLAASLFLMPSISQAKTVRACEAEWKANKAAIQASGKKKTEFMAACRAETATAAPTTQAPAPEPAPQQQTTAAPKPAPAPAPAPQQAPAPTPAPRTATAAPARAGQYASESEAKSHCYGDIVVWANTNSKIYHFAGNRNYGNTKSGAYMCEKEALAGGIRAPLNERHP